VPLADAAAAASAAPARALGMSAPAGTIAPGAPADLVVTDERLRPQRVLRGGRWIV
jgi:N-acetylglucosamine-6-phosphate deacetylase